MSFDLFKIVRKLKHVDILVHVSIADLQRNVDLYTDKQFDAFAPGWSNAIDHTKHEQDGIAVCRPQLLVQPSGCAWSDESKAQRGN